MEDILRRITAEVDATMLLLTCKEFSSLLQPGWKHVVCRTAAANGHLDILKWAKVNGCKWSLDICNYAALYRHRHVLKWEKSISPRDDWLIHEDHHCGHWMDIHYYAESRSICNSLLTEYAVGVGNLRLLKRVIAAGYQPKSSVWTLALPGGHTHILDWALKQDYKLHKNLGKFMGMTPDIKSLQWLCEVQFKRDIIERPELMRIHNYVLIWAQRSGAWHPSQLGEIDRTNCHPDMIKFINSQRSAL